VTGGLLRAPLIAARFSGDDAPYRWGNISREQNKKQCRLFLTN
jgi:hypothetical protein